MTNEQKAVEFLQKVDDWVEDRNADLVNKNEDVASILNLSSDDINNMDITLALSNSFILFAHAEYLQSLYNKEKTVLDFCNNSIWYIVADKMENYGGQYAKWEVRYFSAIKENPLASELNRLKTSAESRITRISGKIDIVKKMASVLQDLGRRRNY